MNIFDDKDNIKDILDCVPGGMGVYHVYEDGIIERKYLNKVFYTYMGYADEDRAIGGSVNPLDEVHSDDKNKVIIVINNVTNRREEAIVECRIRDKNGEYKWFSIRLKPIIFKKGMCIVCVTFIDINSLKTTQLSLLNSHVAAKFANKKEKIIFWVYNIDKKTINMQNHNDESPNYSVVVNNVPESLFESGKPHPDDVDKISDMYKKLEEGIKEYDLIFRVMNEKTSDYDWIHVYYEAVDNSIGTDRIAIGFLTVINKQIEYKERYETERDLRKKLFSKAIQYYEFNLTKGEMMYSQMMLNIEYKFQPSNKLSMKEFEEGLLRNVDEKYHLDMRRIFPDNLIREYKNGHNSIKIEYVRHVPDSNTSVWIRTNVNITKDPVSEDVIAFFYIENIDEEKRQELVFDSLTRGVYEYVAYVNILEDSYKFCYLEDNLENMPSWCGDITPESIEAINNSIHIDDRDIAAYNFSVEGIRDNLSKNDRFRFHLRVKNKNGDTRTKRVTMYYLDNSKECVVVTREDITDDIYLERKRAEALSVALESANQASKAKTQFLSRMSHELRTPMNAIIGLSTLAAGDIYNPEAMEDNISKIGMSARYLLSLINDILEMSRIESGRMLLDEGPFEFERMIAGVNNIIYNQCLEKGLEYEATINGFTEEVYIGDAVKIQQILVNILGNSVKFTGRGGKVSMMIEQVSTNRDSAIIRFTCVDTGIGIDDEFMPHLFDAFSQEKYNYISTTNGTGLGLAITKNIVEMMNGSIRVNTIKNMGTEFVVEIQVGISAESRNQMELIQSMNLTKLSTLIVDDDVIVCKTTEKILKSMGMQTEWVDSGKLAIEVVRQRHEENNDYDTIFIDWKMPDMDGIETSRRIRRIVGPDVTIIIITAYDWKSIESQAIQAGVDMFMEKPFFQSSIVNAFEKIFNTNRNKITMNSDKVFDFTGKRVLLTEDHPLNIEVAKRMLENVGIDVTVAHNGLEALELFTTSSVGYYDAILMDIKMPVMDGWSASKNIRNLKKEDSKRIPIIAMTANAFDDDVKKSKDNGINVHLAKPIEQKKLLYTLEKLFNSVDNE